MPPPLHNAKAPVRLHSLVLSEGEYSVMASVLVDLEPKQVWKHFEALTKIPRASTKEAAARQYVLDIAKRVGLEVTHDKAGNTVIRKPAHRGREGAPMTLL